MVWLRNKTVWFLISWGFFSGCSVEPVPIQYGADYCDFCRMTIVDKRYAAELVNTKGKPYKFDAIECMLRYAAESEQTFQLWLVNTYDKPGQLVDASKAWYLISEQLPSPMRGDINAFSTEKVRDEFHQKYGGDKKTWIDLREAYEVQ